MKLAVILSRVPYPLEKGDKLRAFYQIKELSKYHDIYLFALTEKKIHEETYHVLSPYCKEIHIFPISKLSRLFHLFIGIFNPLPFQVNYFYNHNIHHKLKQLLLAIQPEHIYCQLIRMSEYVKNEKTPKTIDFQDAFSKGIQRRIDSDPIFMKPLLKIEYHRLLRYEKEIIPYFNHHTIITEQDQQLIPHPKNKEISIIPNGINTQLFHPQNTKKKIDILFTGNMSYAPNIATAEYIAKKIAPTLVLKHPNINIVFAGANPTKKVKALQSKNIKITGWVDDITAYYAQAKVFMAPMEIGIGLQNKILEAMSMQIPCITTSLVNNALKATPNKEILIGENPKDFIELFEQLIQNTEFYNSIALNGYQYITKQFSWEKSTEKLNTLFNSD